MPFSALGLSAPLTRAVAELGYTQPTPVQLAAIPAILRGGDVLASARTGSGKTAAFVLPLLERLAATPAESPRPVRVLVLVPTHELATQVAEAVRSFSRYLARPAKTVVVIGGVSINPQLMALRGGADVVIATPGRLLDLVERNGLQLDRLHVLVLDEADRLFSLGFADELARVIELLPERCQYLLFSATLPGPVLRLAEELAQQPTRIDIDAGSTPDETSIVQRAIEVDVGKRTQLLAHLLASCAWSHVLVFVESQHRADHVAAKLAGLGIAATSLHGALSSGARSQALADFKARQLRVLVATDVAARGLDIVQLPAVVNYDLPRSPTDYLHRIGRTGRAGETGVAISFVSAATEAHLRLIEKRHDLAIVREQIPGFEPVELDVPPGDPHGGVKGRRKSKKDKLREAAASAQRGSTPAPSSRGKGGTEPR
ncbi:MAG: ATP-dependent helicase RhlE [Pseudomonadota bacterium]|jgi:ATP-dependent RNA helicase RhlE